jgi:hypothetical protein
MDPSNGADDKHKRDAKVCGWKSLAILVHEHLKPQSTYSLYPLYLLYFAHPLLSSYIAANTLIDS